MEVAGDPPPLDVGRVERRCSSGSRSSCPRRSRRASDQRERELDELEQEQRAEQTGANCRHSPRPLAEIES